MSNEQKMELAMEMRSDLFELANSFAGEENGHVAVMLHEACNCIVRAKERLEAGKPTRETNLEDAAVFIRNNPFMARLMVVV